MSKSLNEVWRQMQIQRQMEQQRQIQMQRQIEEERERARREYVLQNRMLEKTNITVAAAAAAAAGAGGSGNRVIPEPVVISTTGHAVLYYTNEGGVFSYFTYNFENGAQSEIRNITTGSFEVIRPVTDGGYFLRFFDGDIAKNIFYFLSITGEELWSGQNNDGQTYDPEAFSRYISLYYETDTNWILAVLQKNGTVREYTFENQIEGGGYAYDDVYNGGFIVKEIIGDINKYYLIKDDSDTPILLKEIDTLVDNVSVYQYAYSNKILTVKNSEVFEVFSGVDGSLISSFDFSPISDNVSLNNFSFISSNGSFVQTCYDNIGDQRVVLFFSGASDNFDYKTASGTYNVNLDIDSPKNYRIPNNYTNGSALIHFYDSTNNLDSGGFDYNETNLLLPIFGTDETLRNYTGLVGKGIYTSVDSGNLCLLRSENYIAVAIDSTPYGIYNFSDNSGTPYQINDGGNDMYDGGNMIYTEFAQVQYTHTQLSQNYSQGMNSKEFISDGSVITEASVFGASSSPSYFTNLYPGLFIMCAKGTEVDEFWIDGNSGWDGSGTNNTLNFQVATSSSTYQVFVKRSFGNFSEPSVNQIIIVNAATSSGITQSIGGSTDSDFHKVEGLAAAGVTEIYYLLMAQSLGKMISDASITQIAEAFVDMVVSFDSINTLLSELNTNYTKITNKLTTRNELVDLLIFNSLGSPSTSNQIIPRRISDDDRFGTKCVVQSDQISIAVGSFGWNDFSDLESRRFNTFYSANNNQIGNYVVGQKLVMKDTVNEKYWAIEFTQWTQGAGGGFAYTRQLIDAGTFSGEIIHFTHSNYSMDTDIIEPGVLEITRGNNGPIYNVAVEDLSNGRNPQGTLWNSFYTKYYRTTKHVLLSEDGSVLVENSTEGNYSNDWIGESYKLTDESDTTWICNLTESFTPLDRKYSGEIQANLFSTELGISSGFMLLYEGIYHRILTPSSISPEFTLTDSGNVWKISNRDISTTGALIVTVDAFETHYLFYNLKGELVFDKQLDGSTNYTIRSTGKRLSIVYYSSDDVRKVIFFDGESVTEYDTQSTNNISTVPNDWFWWWD